MYRGRSRFSRRRQQNHPKPSPKPSRPQDTDFDHASNILDPSIYHKKQRLTLPSSSSIVPFSNLSSLASSSHSVSSVNTNTNTSTTSGKAFQDDEDTEGNPIQLVKTVFGTQAFRKRKRSGGGERSFVPASASSRRGFLGGERHRFPPSPEVSSAPMDESTQPLPEWLLAALRPIPPSERHVQAHRNIVPREYVNQETSRIPSGPNIPLSHPSPRKPIRFEQSYDVQTMVPASSGIREYGEVVTSRHRLPMRGFQPTPQNHSPVCDEEDARHRFYSSPIQHSMRMRERFPFPPPTSASFSPDLYDERVGERYGCEQSAYIDKLAQAAHDEAFFGRTDDPVHESRTQPFLVTSSSSSPPVTPRNQSPTFSRFEEPEYGTPSPEARSYSRHDLQNASDFEEPEPVHSYFTTFEEEYAEPTYTNTVVYQEAVVEEPTGEEELDAATLEFRELTRGWLPNNPMVSQLLTPARSPSPEPEVDTTWDDQAGVDGHGWTQDQLEMAMEEASHEYFERDTWFPIWQD